MKSILILNFIILSISAIIINKRYIKQKLVNLQRHIDSNEQAFNESIYATDASERLTKIKAIGPKADIYIITKNDERVAIKVIKGNKAITLLDKQYDKIMLRLNNVDLTYKYSWNSKSVFYKCKDANNSILWIEYN